MYRSCYESARKRAAERIFERLIHGVVGTNAAMIDQLYVLTDEEILCVLQLAGLRAEELPDLLDELLGDLDYIVAHEVWTNSPTISDDAKQWVRSATKGAGKGKQSYIQKPAQWEEAIAEASVGKKHLAQIQVILPTPSAYMPKFNGARILRKRAGVFGTEEFFEVTKQMQAILTAMNRYRSTIKVTCPRHFALSAVEAIKKAAVDELGQ